MPWEKQAPFYLLLASAGRTHAAIKTIYLESAAAPNRKGWSMKRPNLYVFLAVPKINNRIIIMMVNCFITKKSVMYLDF